MVHADQPPLAVVNQVGIPRLALPTLVSYPGSHAFRDHGPGLVWDTSTRRLEEPRADERERAIGFSTGTTIVPELIESHRRQTLGQAMDLTSMVWFVGVCLAFQHYNTNGLGEHLAANGSGQGAQEDVVLADMGRVALKNLQFGRTANKHGIESLERSRIKTPLSGLFRMSSKDNRY